MRLKKQIIYAAASLLLAQGCWSMTLEEVLKRVVNTNPDIAIAKESIRESRYALYRAESGFMPRVNVTYRDGRERSRNSSVLALGRNEAILNRRERNITVDQTLFAGGSIVNEFYQQRHLVNASRYEYMLRGQSTLLQATEAYLEVMRQQKLLGLSKVNVNNHKRTLHKVELRYKGGAGNIIDIELSKGRLALAESRYEDAVGQYRQAKAVFYGVVGTLPDDELQWPRSVSSYLPKTEQQALKIALDKHPSLKSRLAQVQAASSGIAVEMGKYYPNVNFSLAYSDNQNLDGVAGPNRDWSGIIDVSLNLFNGFADKSSIQEARSRWRSARHDIELIRRQIFQNVSQTWHSLQANREQIKELIKHVSKSIEVVKGYKLQFNLGKRQLLNVLDAENELFRAQTELVAAEFDAKLDTYRLLASMGRLTTLVLHVPASA